MNEARQETNMHNIILLLAAAAYPIKSLFHYIMHEHCVARRGGK